MNDDILIQLRIEHDFRESVNDIGYSKLFADAAQEIERLRRDNELLQQERKTVWRHNAELEQSWQELAVDRDKWRERATERTAPSHTNNPLNTTGMVDLLLDALHQSRKQAKTWRTIADSLYECGNCEWCIDNYKNAVADALTPESMKD